MPVIGAVFREITGAVLVLRRREVPPGDIFGYLQDKLARLINLLPAPRRATASGIGPQVVERQLFDGQAPGLLGGHLVDGQLQVIGEIIGGKKLLIRLIVDYRQTAAFQLVHPVHEPPQLDALDIEIKALFHGDGDTEIGLMYRPEPGQYLPAEIPVFFFFFYGGIALGEPFLPVNPQQFVQRRRVGRIDLEKMFDAGMKGRAEAEIPPGLRLEAIDILQFVAQGAGAVERNLGKT
jgi:hypothetical protein